MNHNRCLDMNGSLREMVALQDVRLSSVSGMTVKEVVPTRFYAVTSGLIVAAGTYVVASIFSTVATSAFDLRTADLVIQTNFIAFVLVSLGLMLAPFIKMQRFQIRVGSDDTRLFHYQEALVVLAGMLFLNIPLLFLAHSVALYEAMIHFATLSEEARFYLSSAMPFQTLPEAGDVAVCAGFGLVLVGVKGWVFKRVAKRFLQGRRFRAARSVQSADS